jgi:hypothetical protein
VAKKTSGNSSQQIAVSNPLFKLLLWITVGVLLFSFIGVGLLAFFPPKEQSDHQRQFAAMCQAGWQMALGAIFGLLGGRSARPDRVDDA